MERLLDITEGKVSVEQLGGGSDLVASVRD